MIWATEYKHVELVKLLLSKGSDINIRDNVSLWLSLVLSTPQGHGSWRRTEGPGLQSWQLNVLVLGSLTMAVPFFRGFSVAPGPTVVSWDCFVCWPIAGCRLRGRGS